jgi:16S rRNA (uracil1498-N3)-methyltransferase
VALVLDRDGSAPLADVAVDDASDILLVVGPEGGLTPRETAVLTDAGARPVHLGPTVLRSATAGAVAAAVLLSRSQRWMTRQHEASAG